MAYFLRDNWLGRKLVLTLRTVDCGHPRCRYQPSPDVMDEMKHYLEEPSPAVRAQFETMKRLPRLQICVLDQVLSLIPVTQKRRGGTVEIRQVRQGRSLEAFDLNVWTKKQTLLRLMFSAEWWEAAVWNGSPNPPHPRVAEVDQLRRAATPHTITGPKLPQRAPFGPVMYTSPANFKMLNSSRSR